MNESATEADYMSLAPGVGIIPQKYRNLGYSKLPFKAGEGGLGNSVSQGRTDSSMDEFLRAVAAGADPKDYAKQALAATTTGRAQRGRREA
jgi:hypothetical protein